MTKYCDDGIHLVLVVVLETAEDAGLNSVSNSR
jgi:hypothetical protein